MSLIIQNGVEGEQVSWGFPICDSGQTSPITNPSLAFNDPAGPQDLFLECGDPLWLVESRTVAPSPRNWVKITLFADCEGVVSYTRPTTDPMFPVGTAPNYDGVVNYAADGAGNFFWVGHDFTADGTAPIVRIRMVDLTGATSTATIDLRDYAPATLPAPDTAYAFDGASISNDYINWVEQDEGILILTTWEFNNGGSRRVAGLVKVDAALSATGVLVDYSINPREWIETTSTDATVLPLGDGVVAKIVISGTGNRHIRVLSDGSVEANVAVISDFVGVGRPPNTADTGLDNYWVTVEDGDEMLYIRDLTSLVIERYNLDTLTSDPLAWSAGDDIHSFIVSGNGHRVACHEWDRVGNPSGPSNYRVYDAAGTLLLEKSNLTPDDPIDRIWPCEFHFNPLSSTGYKHTIDNRVAFWTQAIEYLSTTERVAKLTLDSILAFRLLAIRTDASFSVANFFPRGQWPHFTYGAWT